MIKVLELEQLQIGYSNKPLIEAFNASINEGEFVVLLGKNGQGKSTLSDTILGLKPAVSGNIKLLDKDLSDISLQMRAELMAAVFSKLHYVPSIKVNELIALGRLHSTRSFMLVEDADKKLVDEIVNFVGIKHLMHSYADELSEGQLQLVMIARALIQDTPLLILDEPTANLDIENQIKIFKLIKRINQEKQKSILFITHDAQLALQFSDKVWWIENGKLDEGFPEDIAYTHGILEKLSGDQLKYNSSTRNYQLNFNSDSVTENPLVVLKYWVNHALTRLNLKMDKKWINQITLSGKTILLDQHEFKTINSLVNYIQHEKYNNNRSE